jgi:hypothetical protein
VRSSGPNALSRSSLLAPGRRAGDRRLAVDLAEPPARGAGIERDVAVAGRVLLADRRDRVAPRRRDVLVEQQRDLGESVLVDRDRPDRPRDRAVDADVHPLHKRERVLELGDDLTDVALGP